MSEHTGDMQQQPAGGSEGLRASLEKLEERVKSLEAELFRADERIDSIELRLQLLSEQRR